MQNPPVLPLPPTPKKRRRALSLATRLQIIAKAEDGLSHRRIAADLGVNKSSVNFTLQRKKFFTEAAAKGVPEECYRMRQPRNPDLDEDVGAFFHWARLQRIPITGTVLRTRGLRAASRLGVEDFKASNGWLHNFQKKKNVALSAIGQFQTSTTSSTVVQEKAEAAMDNLREYLELYASDYIYTMYETTLFFSSVPDSAAALCDERATLIRDGKIPKSSGRITLLICANASGRHILPLAIVGNEERPECFRDRECPLPYFSQANAWMDGMIVRSWFKFFVKEVRSRTTKPIALFMDRFSGDSDLKADEVKVLSFPHGVISCTQPLEATLAVYVKRRYKEELLLKFVQALENYDELRRDSLNVPPGRRGLQYAHPAHLIDAAEILAAIWNSISPAKIAHSWVESRCLRQARVPELAAIAAEDASSARSEEEQLDMFIQNIADRITLLSASFAAVGNSPQMGQFRVDVGKIREEVANYLAEDDRISNTYGSFENDDALFQAFETFMERDRGANWGVRTESPTGAGGGAPPGGNAFGNYTGTSVDQSLPYSQEEARSMLKHLMATARGMQSSVARFDNPLLNGTIRDLLTILGKEREKYRTPIRPSTEQSEVPPAGGVLG